MTPQSDWGGLWPAAGLVRHRTTSDSSWASFRWALPELGHSYLGQKLAGCQSLGWVALPTRMAVVWDMSEEDGLTLTLVTPLLQSTQEEVSSEEEDEEMPEVRELFCVQWGWGIMKGAEALSPCSAAQAPGAGSAGAVSECMHSGLFPCGLFTENLKGVACLSASGCYEGWQ